MAVMEYWYMWFIEAHGKLICFEVHFLAGISNNQFLKMYLFLCIWVALCICTQECNTHRGRRRGSVPGICEQPCECWDMNLSLLGEQTHSSLLSDRFSPRSGLSYLLFPIVSKCYLFPGLHVHMCECVCVHINVCIYAHTHG